MIATSAFINYSKEIQESKGKNFLKNHSYTVVLICMIRIDMGRATSPPNPTTSTDFSSNFFCASGPKLRNTICLAYRSTCAFSSPFSLTHEVRSIVTFGIAHTSIFKFLLCIKRIYILAMFMVLLICDFTQPGPVFCEEKIRRN